MATIQSVQDVKVIRQDLIRLAQRWWFWELLACSASVFSILAIALLLQRYDGRSQPQWPNFININTLVSLFAILVKAPLLLTVGACIGQAKWTHFRSRPHPLKDFAVYDRASRGPEGSLNLLWHFKGK